MQMFKLRHPRAPSNAQGSSHAVYFNVVGGDRVEICDCVKGGIGGTFSLEKARDYYAKKLGEGYTKA